MTLRSNVKILGNNQGTDIPIAPIANPRIAPIITSDFSSIRACLAILKKLEHFLQTKLHGEIHFATRKLLDQICFKKGNLHDPHITDT